MLYGWMKSIVIYLILSGILINLAPANSYKKYINFFMGLMLLIIVAKPLAIFFSFGETDVDNLMNKVNSYIDYNPEVSLGENYSYYDMSLEDSIEDTIRKLGYDIYKVAVITDKNYKILKCTVYIKKDDLTMTSSSKEEIKNYISDVYNVEVDNINIVSR